LIIIMEKHTHRFRASWWFLYILFGSTCLWLAIYISAIISLILAGGDEIAFGDIVLILYAAIFYFLGVLFFTILFTLKIILSPEGLEFHTLGAVIKSRWTDATIRIFRDTTGKNATLYVSNPEIKHSSWTRYAPWDIQKRTMRNLAHYEIPVYLFGGFAPQKFIADIQRFAQKPEK